MICPQSAVAHAAAALQPVFLTGEAADGLALFARGLPDAATGHIVECRLAGPAGYGDYAYAVMPGGPGLTRLSGPRGAAAGTTATLLDSMGGVLSGVDVLWLEFDMMAPGEMSGPSWFVAPARDGSDAQTAAVAAALFKAVWPGHATPDLGRVMEVLPPGGRLRQVGAMAGRPHAIPGLRLVIEGIEMHDLAGTLARMGWPGRREAADRLADLAARHAPHGHCLFDLDIGTASAGMAPALALEVPARAIGSPAALAGDLVRSGLARPEKAHGLAELAQRKVVGAGDTAAPRLEFGLNHVKIALGNDEPPDAIAKAYFSLVATPEFGAQRACTRHEKDVRRT